MYARSKYRGLGVYGEPRTLRDWEKWCRDNRGAVTVGVPCIGIGNRTRLACRVDPKVASLMASAPPKRCSGLDYYAAPAPVQAEHDSKPKPGGNGGALDDIARTTKYAAIAVVALAAMWFVPRTGGRW